MFRVIAAISMLAGLAAAADPASLQAWTLVDSPLAENQWLATWPGVQGILRVDAANASTLANRLEIRRIIGGRDRVTGLAVWRDSYLGTDDLLLYVNSYDDHRVWRYQVDPTTWTVRGQLQMLSPQHPLGLALAASGEHICVSGDTAAGTRVAQCYRISRALADDGVSIDEWWVMVSNFQWDDYATTEPRAEALFYDSQALPTDASAAGSLWVDSKRSAMPLVRFPIDSITGAFMPDPLAVPASLSTNRLSWSDTASTHLLVSIDSAYRIKWLSTSSAPAIVAAEPLHRITTARAWLRAVVWRQASLDAFDRLDLNDGTVVVIEFDRLANAIAIGEVVPSASPSPSASQSASIEPSLSVMPSPTMQPLPTPSFETVDAVADGPTHHHRNNNEELWALVTLVVPCLCVPIAVFVAWRNRRRIGHAVTNPRVMIKWPTSNRTQPYAMQSTGGDLGDWTSLYDPNEARAIALPTKNANSDFGLLRP